MNSGRLLRPEQSRWRPGLMFCDQATSVIYTNLSRGEVEDRFRVADLQSALAQAPNGATRAQAFATIPEPVKSYHAVLQHELDHLRRQFGTSCGFLQMHLRSQLVWACQQSFVELGFSQDAPFPQMRRYMNEAWLGPFTSDPLQLFQRWEAQSSPNRTVLTALATSAAIRGLEQGASTSSRVLADAALFRARGTGDFAPYGFAHPVAKIEFDEGLGAMDIYEHMAVLEELCWRTRLGGGFDDWKILIEGDSRYRRIMMLWHQHFPAKLAADVRSTDLITQVYGLYPIEFYAILDLALWVPFSPYGFKTTRRPIRWEDVQPGHRFLSALAVLKESGRPLTPIASDNRESQFAQTQRWIADELGWESVENLAAGWRTYLQDDRWYDDQLFAGFRDSPAVAVARSVLASRQQSPFDAVCNNISWHQNVGNRFAVWMTNEGKSGCQFHDIGEAGAGSPTRQSYYLFHGCEQLLFGGNSYYLRLETDLRREALHVLRENLYCEGWNDAYFHLTAGLAFGM